MIEVLKIFFGIAGLVSWVWLYFYDWKLSLALLLIMIANNLQQNGKG